MEPLWNPGVATGGNRGQIETPRKTQKHAKSVATAAQGGGQAYDRWQ